MMEATEAGRHAEEKGVILRALKEDFARPMTSVRSLYRALDLLGHSMTLQGMQFALMYLAESEYVQIWRARDVPGFRPDRVSVESPDAIVFVRMLPKGLHLLDGQIPADPSVIF